MPAINKRELRLLCEDVSDQFPHRGQRLAHVIQAGLDSKQLNAADFRIRDLAVALIEDGQEYVDKVCSPRKSGGYQLMEAAGAVDTSAFSNITGQIVYSTVLDAWNSPDFLWPDLVENRSTEFNGEKIPGVSQIGDMAESIQEGNPYPTAGVSEEYVETPTTTKRGFIVPVTKEAIFFDRTGLVLDRARDVAKWLGTNKEKRVLDAVTGITTLYKRNGAAAIATYQTSTPFVNSKTSNALVDWTNVEAVELLFDALTDPNTGEPIMCSPDTMIVPTALKRTAERIVNATQVRVAAGGYPTSGNPSATYQDNPLRGQYKVLSSAYVKARSTSATTYYIGQPKKAFAYMENWPITVTQAPANSEAEFLRDVVSQFKVSERGAVAVVEPRYMVKSTS